MYWSSQTRDYTCHIVVDSEVVIRSINSFADSIKLLFHNIFVGLFEVLHNCEVLAAGLTIDL